MCCVREQKKIKLLPAALCGEECMHFILFNFLLRKNLLGLIKDILNFDLRTRQWRWEVSRCVTFKDRWLYWNKGILIYACVDVIFFGVFSSENVHCTLVRFVCDGNNCWLGGFNVMEGVLRDMYVFLCCVAFPYCLGGTVPLIFMSYLFRKYAQE